MRRLSLIILGGRLDPGEWGCFMRRWQLALLLVVVVLLPCRQGPSEGRTMNSPITVELNELPQQGTWDTALAAFRAYSKIETLQRAVDGIQIVIEIEHDAARDGEIQNPLDLLVAGVLLLDGQGRPVMLPRVAPRTLIHTKGPDKDELRLPFRVRFVEMDGRTFSRAEMEVYAIGFAPKSRMRIGLVVDRIAAGTTPTAPSANAAPDVVPIPAGDYTVQLILIIASPDATSSRTLESAPVRVRLDPG
jgi:hypothetical protein